MDAQTMLQYFANKADIKLNGDREWDIRIHNAATCHRIMRYGTLGLGEAYMEGWWDCPRIDEMIRRALAACLDREAGRNLHSLGHGLMMRFMNLQNVRRAGIVAEQHYNGDRAMFETMLDPYMQYSCAYWKDTDDLAEAQRAKMDLICRKLDLKPGLSVLDIGCGWGGLARYMAENYGVEVTGINVSEEQVAYAKEHARDLPVSYQLLDYRRLPCRQWDRVVSVGMFEHVGRRNYNDYFSTVHRCLRKGGLFLLHSIGGNGGKDTGSDPWLEKYIFPNGVLPSPSSLTQAIEGRFVLEDWHNFGPDYDKTAVAWHKRFEQGYQQGSFQCSEKDRRKFAYYLLSCAGAFRARSIQLWQLVLSPTGVDGGYVCPR